VKIDTLSIIYMQFSVGPSDKDDTNYVYINTCIKEPMSTHVLIKSKEKSGIYKAIHTYSDTNTVKLNSVIRKDLYVMFKELVDITYVDYKTVAMEYCHFTIKKTRDIPSIDKDDFIKLIVTYLKDVPINSQSRYIIKECFILTVMSRDIPSGYINVVNKDTTIELSSITDNIFTTTNSVVSQQIQFKGDFNFETMGIGGLGQEFETIFRRAFVSRIVKPKTVKDLGIKHVKGILLHGPPGTGKTLIARKIGQMLDCVQSDPVLGPSLLGRYVGESEENVRKLFAPALADKSGKLHLIICDEFDSICKKRGMKSDSTGVADNVVNQLLSMIDGPKEINNILLICMTNRIDLIDEAMLRAGRLEVQIEIHLPDERGRLEILEIHTKAMRESRSIDPAGLNLADIAKRCVNYTGAELESLVKSATTIAISRHVDPKKLEDINKATIVVMTSDFIKAIDDIKPLFGSNSEVLSIINSKPYVPSQNEKVIPYILNNIKALPYGQCYNALVTGGNATKLVCDLAKKSGIECIRYIDAESLITIVDRGAHIYDIFNKCFKTREAIVILDGLEYIIEYSPLGNLYNNRTLQVIFAMLKKIISLDKKLVILITSDMLDLLETLGVTKLLHTIEE